MQRSNEIVDPAVRRSAITSHSIGLPELTLLLEAVPADAPADEYERAAVQENALGLATESGRSWRFQTLRRLYLLRPDSVLFRALRNLWDTDAEARPLLAGLLAMATDTVFRATADLIIDTKPGDELAARDFADPVEARFPGIYAESTMKTITSKAYASWSMIGHLAESAARTKTKTRTRATCRPANVAYAFMLGHLEGHRGEALFDSSWARVLDRSRSQLADLAVSASQHGMLEYRSAGGVVEVGFRQLLRPTEGELQ